MLSKRTLLMAATGLLIGYLAKAESPAAASADAGSSILFWLLTGALGLVGLLVIVTGASVASATRHAPLRPAALNQSEPQAEKGSAVC
ncbi:hypothetical protein GCM10023185_20330 [Hymenobacter saemangeumensis]|uniref:Uncharacterized protein n=1 Tax=Hymenobacter saemangeumensis TaxID=1084522 RepID=A0ABP8IDZ3_9BACT